jgi:hypothetical protein
MIEVKHSVELDELARQTRAAYERGDDSWFADHTADAGDVLFYGSAPDEEFRGREAVLALTIARSRAMNEAAGISDDVPPEVECFEAGGAGWVVAHGTFKLADGSAVPVRSVTVLCRDDGGWKRVFGSINVVASNDLLVPGSPLAVQPELKPA